MCSSTKHKRILGVAFIRFFKKTSNYPQFHKKGRHDSFYMDNSVFQVVGKKIYIPKLGWVKMREELRFYGKLCQLPFPVLLTNGLSVSKLIYR